MKAKNCLFAVCLLLFSSNLFAQAGLRASLEKLDRNDDGLIQPDEITSLSRPYLERITKGRYRLNKPLRIDKIQEAARIYHAIQNGVAGKQIIPGRENSVRPFGPQREETVVPEFGLAEIKFSYTQDDLDRAEKTIRRCDKNDDGLIDRTEARNNKWTHRDPFDEDFNNDDRLSRLELAQRYARRRLLQGDAGELIQKAGRVGNGIESSKKPERNERDYYRELWRSGSGRLTIDLMARFDANRNGRLEASEAATFGIPISRIDVDRNNEISRDELLSYMTALQEETRGDVEGLPSWFYERDGNNDQQIAMSEFATEWTEELIAEFAGYDANGDGLLTIAELTNSTAAVGGSFENRTAMVLVPRRSAISEIEVDEDILIGELRLQLSITHTHASQIDAYLTGPDGHRIELFTSVGGSDDNFKNTIFDDRARESIERARPPFQGTFRPEGVSKGQPGLSSFEGKRMKGVWQLVIRGTNNERYGMLHQWTLFVKPGEELADSLASPQESGELPQQPKE